MTKFHSLSKMTGLTTTVPSTNVNLENYCSGFFAKYSRCENHTREKMRSIIAMWLDLVLDDATLRSTRTLVFHGVCKIMKKIFAYYLIRLVKIQTVN